jgi:hypothetical protein
MNKTILEFILDAVIAHKFDDNTLGEEIRQLEETIRSIINIEKDPILEVLDTLISDNPSNEDLGHKIRSIAPLILLALYVETDISGDSDTE